MALKKSLVQRLLEAPKSAARAMKICRMSSSSLSTRSRVRPDLGENGILRRLFHRRARYQPETRPFPVVDGLMAKLKMMDAGRERLRLDGLISLPPLEKRDPVEGLNVEDARKLLRLAQLEAVKMRLRGMNECWIKHERFVELCCEDCGDEGLRVAEILDQSGAVIVFGDMVFLHPQQVVKTIQGLIPVPAARPNDNLKNELEEMEKEKAMIDEKADIRYVASSGAVLPSWFPKLLDLCVSLSGN